jgi:hypothetical protein
MPLMVIFGAGASFDLDYRLPVADNSYPSDGDARLPLARQLFDPYFGKFAARYPACKALLEPMRRAKGAVEVELERLSNETGQHPHVAHQMAAIRYYMRDLISDAQTRWKRRQSDETSNYVPLLDAIERWRGPRSERVHLVTFNYDTLIDEACTSVLARFGLDSVDSYVSDPHMQLFKLHGSTDWYEEVGVSRQAPPSMSQAETEQWLIEMAGPYSEATGRYVKFGEGPPEKWGHSGAAEWSGASRRHSPSQAPG